MRSEEKPEYTMFNICIPKYTSLKIQFSVNRKYDHYLSPLYLDNRENKNLWGDHNLVNHDIIAVFPKQCSVSQVFNMDESHLTWKWMPSRTLLS